MQVFVPGGTESLSSTGSIPRTLHQVPALKRFWIIHSFLHSTTIYFFLSKATEYLLHVSPKLVSGVEWGVRRQSPFLYI